MPESNSTPQVDIAVSAARRIVAARASRAGLRRPDREDLLQEVMTKYINTWGEDRHPENAEAWLETTTANALVDLLRRNGRHDDRRHETLVGDDEDQDAVLAQMFREERTAMQPSKQTQRKELLWAIFRLIDEEEGDLLRKRYVEGFSAADVAELLGITVAAVNQRTTRAKARLRAAIEGRPDLLSELRKPFPRLY